MAKQKQRNRTCFVAPQPSLHHLAKSLILPFLNDHVCLVQLVIFFYFQILMYVVIS